MIKSAISNTVYTRMVTATSIIAKLVVCAVLIAGATCAQAAEAIANQRPSLAKLERDRNDLQSHSRHAALDRLAVCREQGRCEGLKIHPTPGAALVHAASVDP